MGSSKWFMIPSDMEKYILVEEFEIYIHISNYSGLKAIMLRIKLKMYLQHDSTYIKF